MPATLTFLGTRGEIDLTSRRHRRHSSLLVENDGSSVMIDRGRDWSRLPAGLSPNAIVLTHAHDDHAAGLANGADCPVLATAETWARLDRYPVRDRRLVCARRPFPLGGLRFEAFQVEHSLRAPAVGYRVSAGRRSFFYCPDVAVICERRVALHGLSLYVGDGATMQRSMVRTVSGHATGHASIRDQLDWCASEDVPAAMFTHCGSEIVHSDGRRVAALVARLGRERGVAAHVASDGLVTAL
jgi:phosphoribosyl 1,2-cyclic phosphodiesterase